MHTVALPPGLGTAFFVLSEGALEELPELLRTAFGAKRPWPVADDNTYRAAGAEVFGILEAAGMRPYSVRLFPGTPRLHPDYRHAEQLAGEMPADCVPLAVGSGVINDLVKCASGLRKTPYCCVPTACSVDGYTSTGAALSVNGTKKTVPCPAPYAICADTVVLATAPPEMLASGYADLFTKVPAGADWIIADAVGVEPIRKDVWELIQLPLRERLRDAHHLGNVFAGLASTGYGMQLYGESRPASGAEHLFSHVWEMEGLALNGEEVSHGFKVGVGLLASTLLMEYLMARDPGELEAFMKPGLSEAERLAEIDHLLVRGCYGDEPRMTAMRKFLTGAALKERRARILSIWPALREKLRVQLIPFETARAMLKAAGCPVSPAEIGLDREQFLHGIRTAQLIRIRYTVIDLLYEIGLLDHALETVLVKLLD